MSQNPLDAFAEAASQQNVILADRSTLERYATCPAQAVAVDSGLVIDASAAADSGQAAHDAFAEAVAEYVHSAGSVSRRDTVNTIETYARQSRPDVQPDALAAVRPGMWTLASILQETPPGAILRYDGGEGTRGGQLAADIDLGSGSALRVTSEVDLLRSTASRSVVEEIDYKTGRTRHSVGSVAASFQFQMHAWLIFRNYEDVETVDVRVFDTRRNYLTRPVNFERSKVWDYESRIVSAAHRMLEHRGRPLEQASTWPSPAKCPICPAAMVCPVVQKVASLRLIASDPEAAVDTVYQFEQSLAAWRKALAGIRDQRERDIVGKETGMVFGRDKPSERQSPAVFYNSKD